MGWSMEQSVERTHAFSTEGKVSQYIVSQGSWVNVLSATPEALSPDTQDHATLDRLHLSFHRFYVVLFDRSIVKRGEILVSQQKMH